MALSQSIVRSIFSPATSQKLFLPAVSRSASLHPCFYSKPVQSDDSARRLEPKPQRRNDFWNPFNEFESDLNELFRMPFTGMFHSPTFPGQSQQLFAKNFPKVDIVEDTSSFNVSADLPGMEKSDIQVSLEDNVLRISGKRNAEFVEEDQEKHFRRIERTFGSFARSFRVPENIDKQNVEASFENGVLRIQLKKIPEDKRGTTIEIK
jgi:HSP20 family protein